MSKYTKSFYKNRNDNTSYSAEKILLIILGIIPEVKSAIDVGCGVGTWLSVLKKMGVKKICGMDGNWVSKEYLVIPKDSFFTQDLENFRIENNYDLAVSLEVAEHISSDNANSFTRELAQCSDFILFSAATPGQGGVGHINEQWTGYWSSQFTKHGFIGIDPVRKRIWNDEKIPSWYKKNTVLFVKKERINDLRLNNNIVDHIIPEDYCIRFNELMYPGVVTGFRAFVQGIKNKKSRIKSIIQDIF